MIYFLAALASCVAVSGDSLLELLQDKPEYSTLVLVASNFPEVVEALNSTDGTLTLLAPVNAAFEKLQDELDGVQLSDRQLLYVLTYHALTRVKYSTDFRDGKYYKTLNGQNVQAHVSSKGVLINNAKVIEADEEAENGVLHGIDKVLIPPYLFAGIQNYSVCAVPANNIWECMAVAEILDLRDTYPWYFYDCAYPSGCYIKNDKYLWFNGCKMGTECSGVRECVCVEMAPPPPTKTLAELLVASAETDGFTTLLSILTHPKNQDLLNAASNPDATLTVFAPTDDAFAELGDVDPGAPSTKSIVKYHILGVQVASTDLKAQQFPETLMTDPKFVLRKGKGQVLNVQKSDNKVRVNNASVIDADIFTTNRKLDNKVRVNNASVIDADIFATNGVVHVVNKVLLPPLQTSVLASSAGVFEDLVALLSYCNLVNVIDNSPAITIFAPTDEAFAKLYAELGVADVDALIAAAKKDNTTKPFLCEKVLPYHVVPVQAFSIDLTDGQVLPTLAKDQYIVVDISRDKTTIMLDTGNPYNTANEPTVTTANVITKNAAVHVIDNVLLPMEENDGVITKGLCDVPVRTAEKVGFGDKTFNDVRKWNVPSGCFYCFDTDTVYFNRKATQEKCSLINQCICSDQTVSNALKTQGVCKANIQNYWDCRQRAKDVGLHLKSDFVRVTWSHHLPAGCSVYYGTLYFNNYKPGRYPSQGAAECSTTKQCLCA
eukprot:g31360.t1